MFYFPLLAQAGCEDKGSSYLPLAFVVQGKNLIPLFPNNLSSSDSRCISAIKVDKKHHLFQKKLQLRKSARSQIRQMIFIVRQRRKQISLTHSGRSVQTNEDVFLHIERVERKMAPTVLVLYSYFLYSEEKIGCKDVINSHLTCVIHVDAECSMEKSSINQNKTHISNSILRLSCIYRCVLHSFSSLSASLDGR